MWRGSCRLQIPPKRKISEAVALRGAGRALFYPNKAKFSLFFELLEMSWSTVDQWWLNAARFGRSWGPRRLAVAHNQGARDPTIAGHGQGWERGRRSNIEHRTRNV